MFPKHHEVTVKEPIKNDKEESRVQLLSQWQELF